MREGGSGSDCSGTVFVDGRGGGPLYRPAICKPGQSSELLNKMLLKHSRPDIPHSDSYSVTLRCICGQPFWGDSYD